MLQQQVCDAAPFDASEMMPNQLQVSVFIAGFALAGFVLLLDRSGDDGDGHEGSRAHSASALLLALSAIVGLVGAFLFASVSGEQCFNSRLQLDFPTMLMATAALMMVSGISVATASQRRLASTASTLRVVLVISGIMICGQFFTDHIASDIVSRRFEAFEARVDELAGSDVEAGRMATLDRQLALYAEDRWPGREEEWPGLLAEDLFTGTASGALTATLAVVAVLAAIAALAFRGATALAARRADPTAVSRAEERWGTWVSRVSVTSIGVVVALFTSIAATGELIRRPAWVGVIMFAGVTAVFALVVQPPLVHGQSSFIDRAVARLRPAGNDVVVLPPTVDLTATEPSGEPTGEISEDRGRASR